LAAAWTDGCILYAATSLVIAALALVRARLALEPALLVLGAAYGVGCLRYCGGRTLGKLLWGLAVVRTDGDDAGWARVSVREGLGKWLVVGLAPCLVGRSLLQAGWVPTLYDFVAVLPLMLLTLLYYAWARQAWYDQLAGTMVAVRPPMAAVTGRALVLLLGVGTVGAAVKLIERTALGRVPSRTMLYYGMGSTKPYREVLERTTTAPKEYIFDLFGRCDVVVLCERAHSEATQWEFIFDLVQDPRFGERIGHVFTELGQTGMQAYLDEFMATDGLSEPEVNERVLHLMRHWSVWPSWQRVNFPTYLKRLYALNQSLPLACRIRHHFTDQAVDWPNLTRENMPAHWQKLQHRDQQMAQVITDELARLDRMANRPVKGLVVMNYRHAFDLTGGSPQAPRYNTYEYLRDALKNRLANVRINEDLFWPVAGGLWNDAFERLGNRPAGFDLAGTPFGQEPFDLFPWSPSLRGRLRYQDVFTGVVFVNPPAAQYFLEGIPGYYRGWEEEIRRRAALVGPDWERKVEEEIRREEAGQVPVRTPHVVFAIESWVASACVWFCGVGWGLGLVAPVFRRRAGAPVHTREIARTSTLVAAMTGVLLLTTRIGRCW
jgi:uncharacterized RDD family membrane protein YckC